jgi:hypothetical protein
VPDAAMVGKVKRGRDVSFVVRLTGSISCPGFGDSKLHLTSHNVHRPWNQNSRRRWCGSDGYVLFLCHPLNLPTRSPGLGIAYVAALRAKVPVQLYDRSSEQISNGLKFMDRLLAKDVSKGKIQEAEARHARERVSVIDQAMGLRGLRDADMVIEVRNPIDSFPSIPLNVHSRLFQKTSRSSSAYLENWLRRRGLTPSWPLIHLPSLSPKLPPLQYHRASLPRQQWVSAAQGALLVSCKCVGCFHTQTSDYQGSIFSILSR